MLYLLCSTRPPSIQIRTEGMARAVSIWFEWNEMKWIVSVNVEWWLMMEYVTHYGNIYDTLYSAKWNVSLSQRNLFIKFECVCRCEIREVVVVLLDSSVTTHLFSIIFIWKKRMNLQNNLLATAFIHCALPFCHSIVFNFASCLIRRQTEDWNEGRHHRRH